MDSDFEKKLRRQPLRQIPAEWREELLAAVRSPGQPLPRPVASRISWSDLRARLSAILWPSPRAWAGLAAVWVAILAVHFWATDRTVAAGRTGGGGAPVMGNAFREQAQLLAELSQPPSLPVAKPPKPGSTGPRSERRDNFLAT